MTAEADDIRDETRPKFSGYRQTVKVQVHGEHVDFGVESVENFGDRILDHDSQPFRRQLTIGANPTTLVALGCESFVSESGVLVIQNLSRRPASVLLLKYGSATIRIRPSVPALMEIDSVSGWQIVADGNESIPAKITLFSR